MVGRKDVMKFLAEQYTREGNGFVVLYGRTGIGKTTVINEFIKDKRSFYYCVKDCTEKEQKYILANEWMSAYGLKPESIEFHGVFRETVKENGVPEDEKQSDSPGDAGQGETSEETGRSELPGDVSQGETLTDASKAVIVIDEIHLALRQGSGMLEALTEFWEMNAGRNNLMLIITSSSVQWAENSMVGDLGEFAMQITGIHKPAPFGFLEVVNRFRSLSSKDAVYVYGILGGVPGYMDMWDAGKSLRSNIMELFLDKNSVMYREPERFLKSELRELSFYNTILYNLACGRQKLNELHERTGYSRAKISVYIKNLIELDVVEKVFSFDDGNKDDVKKGVYAIKDSVMHFWYKFVFPNMSELERGNREYVYDKKVKPELDNYMKQYFVKMSKEYMMLMSKYNKLPVNIEICESWYGKRFTIDLIAKDAANGKTLAGTCKWDGKKFGVKEFEELVFNLDGAGIETDYYYLFSQSGFSIELAEMANVTDNLYLIALEDM